MGGYRAITAYRRIDVNPGTVEGTAMGDIPALLATAFDLPAWLRYWSAGWADSGSAGS